MAYQAIVNGARGLAFFGGHLTQIARPADAQTGWNWTFWERVLRPLFEELTSSSVAPALVAPDSPKAVKASTKDVELVTREAGDFLYVIAVRRGSGTSRVRFSGLPRRRDGSRSRAGRSCSSTCKRRSGPCESPGMAFATGSGSTTPACTASGGSDAVRSESRA